jgi:hypothetical protein
MPPPRFVGATYTTTRRTRVSTETEQEPKAYENTTGITIGAVRILPASRRRASP